MVQAACKCEEIGRAAVTHFSVETLCFGQAGATRLKTGWRLLSVHCSLLRSVGENPPFSAESSVFFFRNTSSLLPI